MLQLSSPWALLTAGFNEGVNDWMQVYHTRENPKHEIIQK